MDWKFIAITIIYLFLVYTIIVYVDTEEFFKTQFNIIMMIGITLFVFSYVIIENIGEPDDEEDDYE